MMRLIALGSLFVLLFFLSEFAFATDKLSSIQRSTTQSTSQLPSPFFFTENRGQWDSRVLYKCQAKNGMTWFLERDGITLLVSREQGTGNGEQGKQPVRRTFLSDDLYERDLPEML
ncbi:MAG: hypothetical protein OEM52_13685, partial [bacterium]|nr:hypothetical protein [bacterium]